MNSDRQSDRRVTQSIENVWTHEAFFDECVEFYLSKQAGAQLTAEEEAKSWTGEALCRGADRWHAKYGHPQ